MQVRDLADLAICELNAEHLALFDGAMNESNQMFTQRSRRTIGLALHRGWAKQLLEQMLWPCPGPTAAAYSHTRDRRGRRRGT